MALEIDWIARLRTAPSESCPSDAELQAFVTSPEDVTPASFSHIVGGCIDCTAKLQQIALHPSLDQLREYLRCPEEVPEEAVFHCVDCGPCQERVREVLDE